LAHALSTSRHAELKQLLRVLTAESKNDLFDSAGKKSIDDDAVILGQHLQWSRNCAADENVATGFRHLEYLTLC
jgi:hypothetical protein